MAIPVYTTDLTTIQQKDMKDVYPLTIVKDRYNGAYSNAKYTAWNQVFYRISPHIESNDITCMEFWENFKEGVLPTYWDEKLFVGKGNTPEEALSDLKSKINKK